MGSQGASAGTAIAGAGLQAYGAIKSAQDEADFDNKKAALQIAQANELQQRQMANDVINQNAAYQAKLDFGSAYAASGKEGAGVGSQLEIQRQTDLRKMIGDRDAAFQEAMYRSGAAMDQQLAGETKTAGYLNAAGAVLGGAGKAYQTFEPGQKSQQLFGSQGEYIPPPTA